MFRVYLKDKSIYDIKLSEEKDLDYLTRFLCGDASFILVDATCGKIAINKSAIIKIIKL